MAAANVTRLSLKLKDRKRKYTELTKQDDTAIVCIDLTEDNDLLDNAKISSNHHELSSLVSTTDGSSNVQVKISKYFTQRNSLKLKNSHRSNKCSSSKSSTVLKQDSVSVLNADGQELKCGESDIVSNHYDNDSNGIKVESVCCKHEEHRGDDTDELKEEYTSTTGPIDSSLYAQNDTADDQDSSVQENFDLVTVNPPVDEESSSNHAEEASIKPLKELATSSAVVSSHKESDEQQREQYLPYYLNNFITIINTVQNYPDDRILFDDKDLQAVNSFLGLRVAAQKLYVRLFLRVYTWFQCSKLKYANISEDLTDEIKELRTCQLIEGDDCLTDMEEVLNLLQIAELKGLAKMYHVKAGSKSSIIEALKQLRRCQSGFYKGADGRNGISQSVVDRAKSALGPCIRLQKHPRCVFNRMSLLFALTSATYDNDLANGGHTQMVQLMMVNFGRFVYPQYEINRPTPIFASRAEFLTYDSKLQQYYDMNEAFVKGDLDLAMQHYLVARDECKDIINNSITDEGFIERNLPSYLMQYTPGWVCAQILSFGIGVLEKKRMYDDASKELRYLLGQKMFCDIRRGKWWDRLALILEQHLKQPKESLDAVREALADTCVGGGRKLALQQRSVRLCRSPSYKRLHIYKKEFPPVELKDANHITITGRLYPAVGSGVKSVFIRPDKDFDRLCSVEEFALYHYLENEGFTDGLHAEGSTFCTLFTLIMWDILFVPGVPDVFRHPFQGAPLDLMHRSFYTNRKGIIDDKLDQLRSSDDEDIKSMIEVTWTAHEGKICVGINWDRFPEGLPQVQSLAICFGGEILAHLCERFCKSFSAGGLPDLILWNRDTKKVKFSEVKGPNDRLSTKQFLWIDRLISWGIDVDVCHVRGGY